MTISDELGLDEVNEVSRLFDAVWEVSDAASILPANLARAMSHAGSYFAAAFSEDQLVGAAMGFMGFRGGLHLHSHVLGVRPGAQRSGIGFALKQHQRAWALRHGIDTVSWTFDPLVRRNAYFNLCKLGAEIAEYHINFYGEMNDGLNAGDETDRALVRWHLRSARAIAASEGESKEPDVNALISGGASIVLDETPSGVPAASAAGGEVLLCRVPSDIVELRQTDAALARSWRAALRDSLGVALSQGFLASGITRSGYYVLERQQLEGVPEHGRG